VSDARPPASMAWRPVSALYIAGAGLLLVLALAAHTPVPLFAALPLLLAPAAAALGAPRRPGAAKVRWSETGSGPAIGLEVDVTAPDEVAGTDLRVALETPDPFDVVSAPPMKPTASAVQFRRDWRTRFPAFAAIQPPSVAWQDPLGLTELPLAVEAPTLRVERFPPEVGRIGSVRLRRTSSQPGEVRSRALGGSGEFFAIREAASTDTPRQINWRATARMGRLLANEYRLERTGDVLLLLDLRPSALGPQRDGELLAVARAAALGIASGFLAARARVGLGLYDEFLYAVPLGSGRHQRHRILAALEGATLGAVNGPGERLAVSLRRYFPTGVTTVLLSSLVDEEDSLVLLRNLRRRGYPTVVLSPSPLPLLAPPGVALSPDEQIAARLRRLLRRRQIGRTWAEAPVVDWEEYWSLAPFVRLMTAPSHAARGAA
jgi:uncharacterized protein (DUF58 family)